MTANSNKSKQNNKAAHRVLAGVLCGASVLSLVLSLVMPPISQAIANDTQPVSTEETGMGGGSSSEPADVNGATGDTENQNSDEVEGDESGDDALEAVSLSDDTETEGAAQPADDSANGENTIALAEEKADGYTLVDKDVASAFTSGGKFRLKDSAYSNTQITISKDTTIDLAGHMLYHGPGTAESFIVVQNGATLTIEDTGKVVDKTEPATSEPGQRATVEWTGQSGNTKNNGTPKSLTYYETVSAPTEDKLGTIETTTKHVVSGFGAIDAASDNGSVKHVIYVDAGGTLNLKGGMITTAANLRQYGHIIGAAGTVNIEGGYVAGGNCGNGGWGGGLCVTGAKASLNMTGGVIAANMAASGGGVYADNSATLNLSGGVISGNATYGNVCNNGGSPDDGYGGGVFTKGADVTIGGTVNITNNRVDSSINQKEIFNRGLLGGGGIASTTGGKLTMTGGSVTANYSHEAGGGIYAGFYNQPISFSMTGGTIAGNMAQNAEGGGLRIAGGDSTGTHATIDADGKIYITNNKTMTGEQRGGDWGGGGVFIQKGGKLNIVKTLITNNGAGGWGGGVGACPTGETIVSHSNGAAIYDNTDNVDQNGNTVPAYHYSAGGDNKNEDHNEKDYVTPTFQDSGHKDFFLVRNKDNAISTIAVVLGKMLGGESAGWQGTCDGEKITIDANGGAEAKWMFGLAANPSDTAKSYAQRDATTIISGNYSYTHGGGIMTNGDLIVGDVTKGLDVYPNMKLIASKVLEDANGNSTSLEGHEYKFKLLRQDGTNEPSWKADGTFNMGDCSVVGEATVTSDGKITFDSGKDYSSGQYVFYLVEEPVGGANELDTRFDKTIYKIAVTVGNSPVRTEYLMKIPIKYYTVEGVAVYKKAETGSNFAQLNASSYSFMPSEDRTEATVTIGNGNASPTFTNKIVPYTSSGSWTPKATKVVEGGEMKEFTLQLATDKDFTKNIQNKSTQAGGKEPQTLSFDEILYKLSDLDKLETDSTGRGASKTFTYYVREQQPNTPFAHYKYDESVYQITVNAVDDSQGKINVNATYKQIQDRDGKPVTNGTTYDLTDNSTPTFTNIYSTSLPLSGMSGVTLTYLAGAAVLCAAAAWMHIRRKANAKGGERRE